MNLALGYSAWVRISGTVHIYVSSTEVTCIGDHLLKSITCHVRSYILRSYSQGKCKTIKSSINKDG